MLKYIDKSIVNMWNEFNLMIIVCELGYLNIVKELLKVGVNVNIIFYILFLIIVCEDGYLSIVVELLKVGVDVNVCYDVLINVVSENGYLDIVVELIKVGGDVNKVDCL